MTATFPPAEGVRMQWQEMPSVVRAGIEELLGARVVDAVSQPGGFSPGVAARVTLADGSRAFVKAVTGERNAESPDIHRREAYCFAASAVSARGPLSRVLRRRHLGCTRLR